MKIKISDFIADWLAEHNITQGFSVTGGGAMHLNDSFGHKDGLKMLYQHHEQGCAIAAEAYARITGRPALLCVTTGPGGINALNGVCGAYLDSIPMFVISGQVRYDTTARSTGLPLRAMGDQEFDICKAVESMTKYCEMVIDPHKIRFCLEKAYYCAVSGRPGPSWLDIPLNVQGAYVEEEELMNSPHFDPEEYEKEREKDSLPQTLIDDALMEKLFAQMMKAERPVINAGNGIRIAGAFDIFEKMVKLLGIPVVTGWDSIDLMATEDDLYVGRAGIMGDRPGNFAVQNSDFLLSIGSRLSIRQVGYNYESWAREAYVVMNDVDPYELKKPTLHVDMGIAADCRELMEKMVLFATEHPEVLRANERTLWLERCHQWKMKYPVVKESHYGQKELNVYAFIHELSRRLPQDRVTVVGNGSACVVGSAAYVIKKGQRFLINSAIASMGYDLPAAIGADEAIGRKELVCVTGDGSLQMNLQELQTIIHHRLPIKLFVINNEGYHSIRQTQTNFFHRETGIGPETEDLSFPDLEKIAGAYGFPFLRITEEAQMTSSDISSNLLEQTLAFEGPVICEIMVSKNQYFEPKSATKRLDDGTLVSAPLEDLAPFLSREELEENMLIPLWKEK